ncbi:hypothetical protein AXE65_03805 [Ventosimonas gracilis]|uniref:FAD-binding PCMH-type domain-containing protein n=1 Tax=Ventosimonas gracilis TaxID=1680762 RepID=A0A139SRI1_9GAMM|nr:FAD-binding oxidoreductase [Ventosimonas gracilis]KXU37209.1 hypothetical protein AXE65_03805 [Ventosimonas gracilis]
MTTTTKASLLAELAPILGASGLLVGEQVQSRAATFWDNTPMRAKALLRPSSVDELCACLRLCHAARQTVVPLGGNTGLAEGTAATADDIVLSLERLNQIEQIDTVSQTVTVQAGVVLQCLHEQLAAQHWVFPVDLGARGSCTLGGMMATNAGGFGVLVHGMMRAQVLGLEVVLADGSLLSSMHGYLKNNSGYDLKQLFIGSEGTLGVISRAVLRIKPMLGGRTSALLGVARFEQVCELLQCMQRGSGLSAFEVMWPSFWELNTGEYSSLKSPLAGKHNFYVLLECQADSQAGADSACTSALEAAFAQGLLQDAVIARSMAEAQGLWAIREAYEAEQKRFAKVYGFDVSLRIADMQRFATDLDKRLKQVQPSIYLSVYGHLADGNLHLIIGSNPPLPETHAVEEAVYQTLALFGGSISAEHGVGLEKKPWLQLTRNKNELHWMRQIKQLFDPHHLLNPGKIFDRDS